MTSQQEETAYRFMLLKSKCCFAAAISMSGMLCLNSNERYPSIIYSPSQPERDNTQFPTYRSPTRSTTDYKRRYQCSYSIQSRLLRKLVTLTDASDARTILRII